MDDFDEGLILGMVLSEPNPPGNGGWFWLVVVAVIAVSLYGFAQVLG